MTNPQPKVIRERNPMPPWQNEDGSFKSDREISQLGKRWSTKEWDTYLKNFETQITENPIDPNNIQYCTNDTIASFFMTVTESDQHPALSQAARICINSLPSKQKQIVRMIFWENMTQTEAAKKLGISRSAVQTSLRRAKDSLKNMLVKRTFHKCVSEMNELIDKSKRKL